MKRKLEISELIFKVLSYVLLTVFALMCLYPFVYAISASMSGRHAIEYSEVVLLPKDIQFEAFSNMFSNNMFWNSYANTLFLTFYGTLWALGVSILGAYALSKKDLPGRDWMMKLVIFFMLFHAGLIPDYILVANTLKLTNTYWAIWLPVLISSSNLIIMKNFFQQLPASIEESARIDGCNDIQSFIHIVIPMSMASIATFSLFYAVGHWNNYQRAMIYISEPNKFPITVLLRQVVILSQGSLADDVLPEVQVWAPTNSVKYATIMVGTVPIICVYPFLQKHFTKGVLMGSVKG